MRDEAVFEVRRDGRSWRHKNIILSQDGAASYIVYIEGKEEGWEERDMITCYVPNQFSMFTLLNYLLYGQRPVFSSIADFKPLN